MSHDEKRSKRREIRGLHDAIKNNNLEKVEELVSADLDLDFQYAGQWALQIAVTMGAVPICQVLVKHAADVNKANAESNTLLNMAAWRGYTEIAELLVNNGADVNIDNDYSSTPLNTAAYKGFTDVVKVISAQEDCALDKVNRCSESPVCVAVKEGHYDTVQALVAAGCDLESGDSEMKSPLTVAVERGHEGIAKLLIDSGSNLNHRDRYGCTPLWYAAKQGLGGVLGHLTEAGANIDLGDNRGYTPFMQAVLSAHLDLVRRLADTGCDVNLREHDTKQSAVNIAVRMATRFFGESQKLTDLIDLVFSVDGCDLNSSDKSGWTPLYQAAYGGQYDIVLKLLARGVDVSLVTEYSETVLHGAAYGNKPAITEKLIAAGCDVNRVDRKNRLPLYTAVHHKSNIQIIEQLLAAGSETDTRETDEGISPIFVAIQQQYAEAVNLLIQYNADVNTPNKDGDTPLWIACEKGLLDIVKVLLKHPEIDINKGVAHIPLHAATLRGHGQIVKMLLLAGCDVNKMTDLCTTAIYFAADADNIELAKLLIYFGANPEAPHLVRTLPRKCCKSYSDSHPHLELEPLQCAVRNNSFMMAMVILTGSPRMPYKVLNTLRDLLFRTNYMRDANLSRNIIYNYGRFFTTLLRHPRSLRESCRGIVRERLGGRPFEKVEMLPLPGKIREYICLKDSKLWAEY